MRQNLKDVLKAFTISSLFITMALSPIIFDSCGGVTPVKGGTPDLKTDVPDTLVLHSHYANLDVDEFIYQGCEYIRVGPYSQAWGSHKGNCKNHPQSINTTYNPEYKIFGVKTDSIFPIYTVSYTCKGDTAKFIGSIEKCMTFGFDANDVVLWSNL